MIKTEFWTKLNELAVRSDVSASIGGALIGWLVGGDLIHQLTRDAVNYPNLIAGFPNASIWLMIFNPIMGGILAFTIVKIASSLFNAHAMDADELMAARASEDGFLYNLLPFPVIKGLQLVLGESHGGNVNTQNFIESPEWYVIPSKGLFQSTIVLGGTGCGKSEFLMFPKIKDLLSFRPLDLDYKIGGLFMEPKGVMAAKLAEFMREVGREDLYVIEPEGIHVWNPIHAEATAHAVAGWMMAVLERINPAGDQNAFITEMVNKLYWHGYGLHRIVFGYVTFVDVHNIIVKTSEAGSQVDINSGDKINATIAYIDSIYKSAWDTQTRSVRDTEDFWLHYNFFIFEWAEQSEKNKPMYVSSATSLTQIFTIPGMVETFCPKLEDITFAGFDDIIDKGSVVVLNAPIALHGSMIAGALGIFLKLAFQRSALARSARSAKNPSVNLKRPIAMVIDEYQRFCTVSSARCSDGDDVYFDTSRSNLCINVLACQTKQSLQAVLGPEKTRVILANILTKICFRISDPEDAEWLANLFGKQRQSFESHSIGENSTGAFNPLTNDVSGPNTGISLTSSFSNEMTHLVDPITLSNLSTGSAIVYTSDGFDQRPPVRVYMKPTFVPDDLKHLYSNPNQVPYNELIISMKKYEAHKALVTGEI